MWPFRKKTPKTVDPVVQLLINSWKNHPEEWELSRTATGHVARRPQKASVPVHEELNVAWDEDKNKNILDIRIFRPILFFPSRYDHELLRQQLVQLIDTHRIRLCAKALIAPSRG